MPCKRLVTLALLALPALLVLAGCAAHAPQPKARPAAARPTFYADKTLSAQDQALQKEIMDSLHAYFKKTGADGSAGIEIKEVSVTFGSFTQGGPRAVLAEIDDISGVHKSKDKEAVDLFTMLHQLHWLNAYTTVCELGMKRGDLAEFACLVTLRGRPMVLYRGDRDLYQAYSKQKIDMKEFNQRSGTVLDK